METELYLCLVSVYLCVLLIEDEMLCSFLLFFHHILQQNDGRHFSMSVKQITFLKYIYSIQYMYEYMVDQEICCYDILAIASTVSKHES